VKKPRNILGLDIGGTKTAIIFGNEIGQIFDRISFPTLTEKGFKKSFNNICDNILNFIERHSTEKFSCISVSIGGPLNIEEGIIYSPPNLPGWKNIPLKRMLEKRFPIPAYIEHDGNAGALAEYYFGAGKGFKNIIFLTMGTGIGAGIILDGKIYRGSNDMAGELWHIRLAEDGPAVYGKRGVFESFCSGSGIYKLAKTLYPKKYGSITGAKEVIDDLKKKDKNAEHIISITAKYLGRGLAVLVDILNPQVIIIGSLAVRLGDKLIKPAVVEMKKEALVRAASACKVIPSKLGEQIGDYASLCAGIVNLRK
jgi:glucokinase